MNMAITSSTSVTLGSLDPYGLGSSASSGTPNPVNTQRPVHGPHFANIDIANPTAGSRIPIRPPHQQFTVGRSIRGSKKFSI